MAETGVQVLLGLAIKQLNTSRMLQRKCKTLSRFLLVLKSELPNMVAHQQGELIEIEAVLVQLVDVIDSITSKSVGKLTNVMRFFQARQKVEELDEIHSKLVELLEAFKFRQSNNVERGMQRLDERLAEIQRMIDAQHAKDDREDLAEDRAEFQGLPEINSGEVDPELQELVELGMEMPDEEFDRALRSKGNTSRIKLLMMSISTRTQMEACTSEANIKPEDLVVDQNDRLGAGAFGEVMGGSYRGKPVAVKRALDISLMGFKVQEELRVEAERWKGLEHRNIVRLIGTCILDNRLALVMERCDVSLFDALYRRSESIQEDCQKSIFRGISKGLAYLHKRNLIHRDLKPMNVLMSYDCGSVKISDFGLMTAKQVHLSHAQTTSVKGTWVYMAPEVLCEPAKWTTRADIYALGMVMWEVLHREVPWSGNLNPLALMSKVGGRGERPEFSSESISLRKDIVSLIEQCWSQEAADRPSAEEVANSLEEKSSSMKRKSMEILKDFLHFVPEERKKKAASMDMSLPVGPPTMDDVSRALHAVKTEAGLTDGIRLLLACLHSQHSTSANDDEPIKMLRKQAWRWEAGSSVLQVLKNPKLVSTVSNDTIADCLAALAFMLQHDENASCAKELKDMGGEKVVLLMIRKSLKDPHITANGCFVMMKLAAHSDVRADLFAQDAATLIQEVMERHEEDEEVLFRACGALMFFALEDDAKVELTDLGVGKQIVDAMERYPDSLQLQQQACGALMNLTFNNSKGQKNFMDLGAGETILAAMKKFPENPDLQKFGCGALWNLAGLNDNTKALLTLNAPDVVIQAMENHRRRADVQESACGCLAVLTLPKDKEGIFMGLGAPDFVLKAMLRHKTILGIQKNGCAVLWNLRTSPNGLAILRELNALAAVEKALSLHPSDSDLAVLGGQLLKILSKPPSGLSKLVKKIPFPKRKPSASA